MLDKQDSAEVKNYTRTANMLIYSYHDTLSPQEKWLYVCLKHMCGRKGTRHLSLRYISEQTGISTGALSKSKHSEGMIRHLHDAGLIHAEIKKHDGKGNPQYHITITDIWALNQAFFDKTRSEFGQDEDIDAEPVRISDEPVQNSDKLVQNSDEPVRNSGNTNTRSKTITKITEQDESFGASARAELIEDISHMYPKVKEEFKRATDKHKAIKLSENETHSQDEDETPTVKMGAVKIGATHGVDRRSGPDDLPRGASSGSADARDRADDVHQGHAATAPVIPKRPRGKKPRAEPEPAPKFDLTAEQQHFWSLWCGVWFNQDIPPEMTETAYKHVVKLAPHITTAELLNSLIAYTRKDLQETQGIKRKAVQLGNCVNSYRGWKQVQREETPPQDEPNIGRNGLDLNQYGLQALLERQAAAEGV